MKTENIFHKNAENKNFPREDIKRTPLELIEVQEDDFDQNLEINRQKIESRLQEIIKSFNYDTFSVIGSILADYIEELRRGKIISLPEILQRKQLLEVDSQGKGRSCVGMAVETKKALDQEDIYSYFLRYQATGQINEAGNNYAGVSHLSVIIPSKKDGKKIFTILDSGLLIPKLIEFEDKKDSREIFYRNKKCQIKYNPENKKYPYQLLIFEKSKKGYILTDKAFFDPYHRLENPEVVLESTLRTIPGYRLTAQNEQGQNQALISLDINKRILKFRFRNKENEILQHKVNFDNFYKFEKENQDFISELFNKLGRSKKEIFNIIYEIINNYEVYVEQFLPPSVREEFKKERNFKSYNERIKRLIAKWSKNETEEERLGYFFNSVLPGFARGKIEFHENIYQLEFGTYIFDKNEPIIIPSKNKIEEREETGFGNASPFLMIENPEEFAQIILDLLSIVDKKKDDIFWLKSRDSYNSKEIFNNFLKQIWFNATEKDFLNPKEFLLQQKEILKNRIFEDFSEGVDFGPIEELLNYRLFIKRESQSGSNESPFMMNIELISEDKEGRADLFSIRYAIKKNEREEKKAIIFAVQRQKKDYNSDVSKKVQKKVNRKLFRLNKNVLRSESEEFREFYRKRQRGELEEGEVMPPNILAISPSAVFSLATFFILLKERGVTRVEAPLFLPLRWQAHSRFNREEQARIQKNVTIKFFRNFKRIAYHFNGIDILPSDKKNSDYIVLRICKEISVENAVLKNIQRVIEARFCKS